MTKSQAAPSPPIPGLRIAVEGSRDGYDRDRFQHWLDTDGNGCDTREEVLVAEAVGSGALALSRDDNRQNCRVTMGTWFSVYDGEVVTDPSALDVDHVVALGEAWDSGASGWTDDQRRLYANDLEHPESLRAVTAASNRSKSDRDPAEWVPPLESFRCQYARDWVSVKVTWSLSADKAEVGALRMLLSRC